jgi:PRTRC genetic system ThiF family protein
LQRNKPLYWLDLGNGKNTGQAVLATIGYIKQPNSERYEPVAALPYVTKEFKEQLEQQDDTNEPSCSLAEALEKQDLLINSTLANIAASLLWKLFREGMTDTRGFFLNLANFQSQPIKVG